MIKNKKKLFNKKEIFKLCFKKRKFNLNYNNHIMFFFEIWGTNKDNKKVITYKTYINLFKRPDGFLRACLYLNNIVFYFSETIDLTRLANQ